ncbi:HNH endonuclease [Candidatus Parcubacteria bacterium]|nr:MAG: HNH endonuclease [Candidatus Parcubacteria bacterium]
MSVIDCHVLILNKSWVAIGTSTVKDAVILLSRNSAKVLSPSTYRTYTWEAWLAAASEITEVKNYIKTPSLDIPAPEIIILSNYNDVFRTTVKFSTRAIFRRDNYICAYCNKHKKVEDLSVDHIIPRSRKGGTNWLNCVTSCFECNNKKSNLTPAEAGMVLHYKPFIPKWSPVIHVREESRPKSWEKLIKKEQWNQKLE